MIRSRVILAVAWRNFSSYFSSVLGYLFIVVFCVASSVMAFNSQFFAANQANLDQLSQQFPLLLLFLIPAITMTTWAEEKKLGTDELLFTMPASDTEILLGKYFAVLGVYTVALLFSTVNYVILTFLGDPDEGLVITSYIGYWLSGASLLAVGMLASALTSSATVAFVLGVVLCCIPVFIGHVADLVEWVMGLFGSTRHLYGLRVALDNLSLQAQLRDFSLGVLPLSSIFYFVFLTGIALYLNFVVISRRRWAGVGGGRAGLHFAIRTFCLLVTLVSGLVILNLFPVRADLTAEKLFTLSDATYKTLESIKDQRVTIQAFVSPVVPREYSETRRQLLGLLREFDLRGGANLEVRVVEVEPFSEEAEQARALGIEPVRIQYQQDGRFEEAEVFLGAVVQSTTDVVRIPFFDKGIPIEYELTRSVRTVSKDGRLTVGILQTDAEVMGGMGGRPWEIVTELRKQYKVINVNPSQKILVDDKAESDEGDDSAEKSTGEKFDLLLAVMPSSLTQPQMDNFLEYVESGKPVLIFDDVFPAFNPQLAPRLPKPTPGGQMAMFNQQRPEPKADNGTLRSLMELLGAEWDNGACVFDNSNPHSEFSYLRPEVFFISRSGNRNAFSDESPITRDLQDVVCMFAGAILEKGRDDSRDFLPLLQTSGNSGLLKWEEYTESTFNPFMPGPPVRLKEHPNYFVDKYSYVIAAHVTSDNEDRPLNVVFCADADMIGDQFFTLRASGSLDVEFDNVTFVLNAVDTLVGDETFIELRSRRPAMRTLKYVEDQTRDLSRKLSEEQKKADEETKKRLDEARKELQKEIEELEKRTDIDTVSKSQLLRQKQEQLNKKIEDEEKELERRKNDRIRQAGLEMKRAIRRIENRVRMIAWIAPAILPICFGLLFLGLRNLSEQQSVSADRRRR